jgi:hypothetical protein
LQDVQKHVKEVYGPNYTQSHPEADALKQQIYRIFDADTLTQATQRYDAVLALRPGYVQAVPEASAIFDFLERHRSTICAGLSILWPLQPSDTSHVPNL